MSFKPPTIRTIAMELGLSKSTVAYALRGEPQVAQETAKKVRETAERLGYRPNPWFSRMGEGSQQKNPKQAQHSNIIYLYLDNSDDYGFGKNSAYAKAVLKTAAQLGYTASAVKLPDWESRPLLMRRLYAQGVDGLVLAQSSAPNQFDNIDFSRFAVVAIGEGRHAPPVTRVRPSITGTFVKLMQEVHQRGYKRPGVALIPVTPPVQDDARREAGYLQSSRVFYGEKLPLYELKTEYNPQELIQFVRTNQLDVVIGFNNFVHYMLIQGGMKIPQEVAYASLLIIPSLDADRGISGILMDQAYIGERAMLQLDQLIRHNERGLLSRPSTIVLPMEYRDGETLPDLGH